MPKQFDDAEGMVFGTLTVKELIAVLKTVDPNLLIAVLEDDDGNRYRAVEYSQVSSMIQVDSLSRNQIDLTDDDALGSKKYFIIGV
jgi:hypothetical protein